MDTEQFIREQVRKILLEKKDDEASPQPGKLGSEIMVKGSIPGAPPKGMKALADTDPVQLMKNLNAAGKSFSGDNQTKNMMAVIEVSIGGTDTMTKAFKGVREAKDANGIEGVLVRVGDLDIKNGVRYIKYVLQAAVAAEMLKASEDIRVQHTNEGVLVYPSKDARPIWA